MNNLIYYIENMTSENSLLQTKMKIELDKPVNWYAVLANPCACFFNT